MEATEKDKGTTPVPPYVAYRTLRNFVRSLVQVIPNQIDKSTMSTLSGGVQIQLLLALKYLGLITTSGSPTDQLKTLVKAKDDEYKAALRETLTAAYPFLSSKSVDLSNATMQQLQTEFSKLATGDTARKCVTFFIPAAIDAGFQLSPYIKKPGARAPTNGKPRKVKQGKKAGDEPKKQSDSTLAKSDGGQVPMTWQEMMLKKFPDFDPSWKDELKTKWFEGFEKLEKLMIK